MAIKTTAADKARSNCKKKFLFYFRKGFTTQKYYDWERGYKWEAHVLWMEVLNKKEYKRLLDAGEYLEIANRATRIESKTNLLFSFEKMALRDAVKTADGAKTFAEGLYNFVYGGGRLQKRFEEWVEAVAALPRKQTRVLTWPLVTVFGFIANPAEHIFLKPRVTKIAAEKYAFDFKYTSRPNWDTYSNYLAFAEQVGADVMDLQPKDMIDIQSFLWVMGSDEYPE
ncbi:MAG: hypothetical protein K0Q66_1266 [Chitinophagaceae bacterium]|nr:hypothetical protein [Chitinophagaceae bacterium]